MTKKEKAIYVLQELEKIFPQAKSELENWETPFQFLICIILSAQTTDKQVNKVTKKLFEKCPTSAKMAKADTSIVSDLIKSVNFWRNKSKYIIAAAKSIEKDYAGKVPDSESGLIKLPGVGKKTAHVFLNVLYKRNDGIGVDTHVARVARRLGLTTETKPEKIAQDLQDLYPRKDWYKINATFVLFGRYICKAKNPDVERCPFDWCECKKLVKTSK